MDKHEQVFAPFNDDQIKSLNEFQKTRAFHPFTCGKRGQHSGSDDILVASASGWTCPSCDYKQNWAHAFMANWRWKHAIEAFEAKLEKLKREP